MGSKLTAQQWKVLSLDWRKNLDERIQNSQDSETKWIGVLDVVVCH